MKRWFISVVAAATVISCAGAQKAGPKVTAEQERSSVQPDQAARTTPNQTKTTQGNTPQEKTEYFLGDRRAYSSSNDESAEGAMLCRRIYRPKAAKIIMEIIDVDPRPQVPTLLFRTTAVVDGSTVTVKEESGAFSGSGTLEGPPWDWTGSTITYRTPDGGRIVAEEQRTEKGLYVVNKVFDPEGNLRVTFEETFKSISAEAYEAQRQVALEKNETLPAQDEAAEWE